MSTWKGVKSILYGGPLIDDLTECLGKKLPRLSSCIFVGFGEDSSSAGNGYHATESPQPRLSYK